MKTLNLGSVQIPLNGATKTFAFLAKRGAGKTYSAAVMAEEMAYNNIPFVVFDPIDVWWGLRLAANGKDKGLPVVVFGLDHADIHLTRDMGKQIAQAITKENISCVISTFGMPKVAQRELIADFSTELLNINKTARHVFIEEAHEFVPQRVHGAMGKVFAAVEALVVMGRNRGIGVSLINQRAATVNKDVLTQLDTLLAFRNTSPQDRKALKEWVEHHSAEGDFNKFMDSLPSLPTGKGWIWSPEFMNVFEKIEIRKRNTFHPDREKLGDTFEMPAIDQGDIEGFINKFKTIKPEIKEPGYVRKDSKNMIKELEPIASLKNELKSEYDRGFGEGVYSVKNEYESQIIDKDAEIALLSQENRKLSEIVQFVKKAVESDITTSISNTTIRSNNINTEMIKNLPKYEKEVMDAIIPHPGIPFTRSQLALKAGKSYTSSSYLAAIRRLIKLGLLQENNGTLIYI